MNFMPDFSPATPNATQRTAVLRSSVLSAPLRYLCSFTTENLKLIELAARGTGRSFALALLGLTRFFGVEAALFAAADAAMRPQTFEDHFGGGCGGTGVLAILNAEPADVFHQALNFRKLLITLVGGCQVWEPQFAA